MNKTITVYELLGMIKDGKAPKKIKYGNYYYEYIKKEKRYYNCDSSVLDLSDRLGDYNFNYLDDEVEIIEDNDKLEKIEKLDLDYKSNIYSDEYTFKKEIMFYCDNLQSKINVLIDHINKIEERLDEK